MNISEARLYRDTQIAPVERLEFDTSYGVDVAHIKIFTDLAEARTDWKKFETAAVHTVFQTHGWLFAWQEHIGSKSGIEPQIIIGYGQDGTIRFLLPLAIKTMGPLRILCFLGCEEASYQFGLFAPRFARSLDTARAIEFMQQIKALLPRFDVMRFQRQPFEWQGLKNPLSWVDHKPAPSCGYAITLNADYQTLYDATRSWKSQSKILRRERKLAKHGEIEFKRCESEDETSRVLDIMFAQKEKRFCEQGIDNFLNQPGVQNFYRCLCLRPKSDDTCALELHYYTCGNQVLAVIMGMPYGDIEFGLINSMSDGPLRNHSPGLHALHRNIERLCGIDKASFDLGVGAHSYKDLWADNERQLFDTIIPASLMGYLYAYGSGFFLTIKRHIKNSKVLWPMFMKCRAKMFFLKNPNTCPEVNETL